MKILMVAPRFSARSGGGGYVITKNLIKALEKRNHQIGVFTSDYQFDVLDAYDGINENGKRVWLMPFKTILTISSLHITRPHTDWRAGVFTPDVDIIHMQGCRTWQNIVAYKQAKKYGIPYIVDAHGFPTQGTIFHRLILWLFDIIFANRIVREADLCIAETETGRQEYLRAGARGNRIQIISCPYDLSVFDDLPSRGTFRDKEKIDKNAQIIGFLGGLDRIKGVDYLIRSFALYSKEISGKKAPFLVIGGTDMGHKKELDRLVDHLGVHNNVIFTGYISGRDKLEFLVDCDVCVFPSRAEQGLPFAALESIMCGTPIVVADGTGSAEDVTKMGGFIVKFGDEEELARLLHIIINSNGVVKSMTKSQQDYIKANLSLDEQVKLYEKEYEEIVSRKAWAEFYKRLYYIE